jgi:aryl-alcohol dehydrogenase-like predicted oxidoreductase
MTNKSSNAPTLPRRAYGQDGIELSIIGCGAIALQGHEQNYCNRLVAESIERGVNYFDVAPSYGQGEAETKLGPALEPYRKDCFLACKTGEREGVGAKAELAQSLERLRTDHLDLYQLHGLIDMEKDVDAVFALGGAMEVFVEAKKSGKIRHLGFSAHTEEAALAAMDRFDFDSILFPINFVTVMKGHFGSSVMAKAKEKGVSILALKAMAQQLWPENDPDRQVFCNIWYQPVQDRELAKLALFYTLSEPVTAALAPGNDTLLRLAMDLAMDFEPITPEQTQQLMDAAQDKNPIFQAT